MSLPAFIENTTHQINSILHRFGRTTLLVLCLWFITLWWGERLVFEKSIGACGWQKWESWPADAYPHHVLFVADPQLVDPHTYPGRPWPLSTLTVLYTDLYLRRSYRYLLDRTQPHTTLFLGDLFDGGREWAAADYQSPEARYKSYGTEFWLREYNRFMKMFINGWYNNQWDGYLTGEGRKIISSLPGNHDLGFASGVNGHVRNRFEAHFGPSNRIDILGNHTFVSLDSVSLSAMDQVDPATGASGAGDGTGQQTPHTEIWKPTEQFLVDAKHQRAKAVQQRYQHLRSQSDSKSVSDETSSVSSSSFPTIVLSHVPFFRNPDVDCGPMRERGRAISITAGYQYQNVLTPGISKDIVDHLDAEQISMIYSGDDHDYCEIEHGEFTGSIKEITVKSMSWAMGVRRPGVQLASLWNPIDTDTISQGRSYSSTPRDTVQNHLCLLPDQLGIFIRYGQLLALTLVILLVRAIIYNPTQAREQIFSTFTKKEKASPLLPMTRKLTPPSSPTISPEPHGTTNTIQNHAARSRSNGKLSTYGNLPSSSRSASPVTFSTNFHPDKEADEWDMPTTPISSSAFKRHNSSTNRTGISITVRLIHDLTAPSATKSGEFARSLCLVAGPVLLFYTWILSNG